MLLSIIDLLIHADRQLFNFIHHQLHADWLNNLMLTARHEFTWIPLYLFLLYKVFRFNKNAVLPFVLVSLLCFGITDYISAAVIKPMVGRLRPCYDAVVAANMYHLIECGGKFSFPSSHASNHFGLAMCWFTSIRTTINKRWYWLWLWAAFICFAQIYVGKHFPLDIAGGFMLGSAVGYITGNIYTKWFNHTNALFWAKNKI